VDGEDEASVAEDVKHLGGSQQGKVMNHILSQEPGPL
jgi:hypothetical protein